MLKSIGQFFSGIFYPQQNPVLPIPPVPGVPSELIFVEPAPDQSQPTFVEEMIYVEPEREIPQVFNLHEYNKSALAQHFLMFEMNANDATMSLQTLVSNAQKVEQAISDITEVKIARALESYPNLNGIIEHLKRSVKLLPVELQRDYVNRLSTIKQWSPLSTVTESERNPLAVPRGLSFQAPVKKEPNQVSKKPRHTAATRAEEEAKKMKPSTPTRQRKERGFKL